MGWTVWGSNPGGGEIFRNCPDQPWGPPSLLYNGYRVFTGGKERLGCDADPSPLLVPWSRKGRAIPLLPLWAVRPVQGLSACTRMHFTFFTFIGFCIITRFKERSRFSFISQNNQQMEHAINFLSPRKCKISVSSDWITSVLMFLIKVVSSCL